MNPTRPASLVALRDVPIIALCAGALRLFLEWALGGPYLLFPLSDLAMAASFFWLALFAYGLVLRVAAGAPWREAWPAAVALTAIGTLPPLIDAALGHGGFAYGYLWSFPSGYTFALAQPVAGISYGEAAAMWIVTAGAGAYTYFITKSALRAVAAAALAYVAEVVLFGGIPALAESLRLVHGWPVDHRRTAFSLLLVGVAAVVYLALRPAVARGLATRIHHALPFIACCFAGSAFAGGVFAATYAYAVTLLAMFILWLAQNDLYDAPDDALQGRTEYLDAEDVAFFSVTCAFVIAILVSVNSNAVLPLLVVVVTSTLYNLPFYRAKRYFPSNLKMEGMWGLASFTLGAVAATEHKAYGAPRWWLGGVPDAKDPAFVGYFDDATLWAMLLVFGGFSLVAVLKDYKDWEADLAARIQTVYTLAARKGANLSKVHTAFTLASSAALALSGLLAAATGKLAWAHAPAGAVAGALVAMLMLSAPSAGRFRATLYVLAAYFAYLALTLRSVS